MVAMNEVDQPVSEGAGAATEAPLDGIRQAMRDPHSVRAVLSIASFRRLWLALGLSSLGDWLGLLAITVMAQRIPESSSAKYFAVSTVFIIRLAPAVLLGPLAGVIADRFPRRLILVAGDVLRFLLFLSIPIVGELWWIFVATALVEIVGIFWLPTKDATMPGLVPRDRLEAAHQLSLAVTYGSAPVAALLFVGLALLSGILDNFIPHLAGNSAYLALYVNAVTFLISAIVIAGLELPPGPSGSGPASSFWRTATEGWRFVAATPVVRGLVLGMLGAFGAGGVVIGLAPIFVGDMKAGAPGFGLLFAAVFLGLATGMWLIPRLLPEFPRRRLFGLAIAGAGLWLILMSLVPSMPLSVFFTFGLGFCAGTAWVTGYTLLGLEVGDDIRGRTFAFVQSMVRVVLITVLAVAPSVAAGLNKLLGLPQSWQINDFISLTYTGVMATFLMAGVLATTIGVVAYRQMDDRPGISLFADVRQAIEQRSDVELLPQRSFPGRLIAIEGGDGAGKSTQIRLLHQWLAEQGFPVVATREPGGTSLGQELRDILLHGEDLGARAETLLFAADRAHHVESVIRPGLTEGKIMLTDRYCDSSIAYQGGGRELGRQEVARISQWAATGLVPDLTVLLDLDPALATARRREPADRLESASTAFHLRSRQTFLELARRAPSRYLVLAADAGPQELHLQIRQHVAKVLPESPVGRAAREQAEAAQRAAVAAQRAAEAAQAAAEEKERARLRAEAMAEIRVQKLREQQARLERAAIEATARARQLKDQQQKARSATEAISRPEVPRTTPLPQVGITRNTARPRPAPNPAPAEPKSGPRPSLDDEIFSLGQDPS